MRVNTLTGVLVALAALTLPLYVPNEYYLHLAIMVSLYAIGASGLNIMMGYLGLLPLCVAAFIGVGAYSSANLTMVLNLPFLISLFLSAAIAGFIAFLLAIPSFRVKGIYYVIVTIGFQIIIHEVYMNLVTVTGGSIGLRNIPKPSIGPLVFSSKIEVYYLIVIAAIIIHAILFTLLNSSFGLSLRAIRENEQKALMMGLDSYKHKLFAFTVSMVTAALAGVLYAHYITHVSSDDFTLLNSIDYFLMVTIGGPGTFYGPVVGALVWTFVKEILQAFAGLKEFFYGVILIAIMLASSLGKEGLFTSNIFAKLFRLSKGLKSFLLS